MEFKRDAFREELTDPRAKQATYPQYVSLKNINSTFEPTQFLIDDNYVGEPPHIQIAIANLNDNINEAFLRKDLSKLGKIRTLEIVRHPETKVHLGLAKVEFATVDVAKACIENYHGKQMMGRQLNVFKDVRFNILEKIKEAKLNPKPQPPPIAKAPHIVMPQTLPQQPIVVDPTTLHPMLPAHLQKPNSIGAIPSPRSSEYPLTTPSSITSSSTTPDSLSRGRLDERIAKMKSQPYNVLSAIVGPTPPQTIANLRPYNTNESNHDYPNNKFYHLGQQMAIASSNQNSKFRSEQHEFRRQDSNSHNNHLYKNQKDFHNKFDRAGNKSDRYSDNNSEDEWNKSPEREPETIELTEEQIKEAADHCFELYYDELRRTLNFTVYKKLKESHGFQCIEKAQLEHRARIDEAKRKEEKERNNREHQRELEKVFLNKHRAVLVQEAPRQRVNILRQRTSDYNSMQDDRRKGQADLRRVNRSAAYVAEPDRRGSHTSLGSDLSSVDSSSASSSSSSSRSSRSGSRSSSSLRSISSSSASSSSSSSSASFSDDASSDISDSFSGSDEEYTAKIKPSKANLQTPDKGMKSVTDERRHDAEELEMAETLLALKQNNNDVDMDRTINASAKKRKKKATDVIGIAPEYGTAKKFAAGRQIYDDNEENAMVDDENFQEEKPEAKVIFAERSEEEKKRLLDDLFGTLSEEDIKYLAQVHHDESLKKNQDVEIPFGSDNANRAHLNLRKQMIEGKAADGHPKWWRGCSRCDVIKVSEKGKQEVEETNYEDLTKAPIKSHVIQAANSSRRDNRGDQRRIAALNADLDPELIKMYTTNTLQMRAKNLRFSRSKIHKWGLFACEKIASGDAVIEYVGEKIRPSLADHREKVVYTNLPTHDGSSYFFRVDFDVIDATLKGNKARFINHSCNPNCIAKVIKHDNGTNSIVIYAKQPIQEDEEITYDYKFPREENENKIHCNCRAPNCQKYLN